MVSTSDEDAFKSNDRYVLGIEHPRADTNLQHQCKLQFRSYMSIEILTNLSSYAVTFALLLSYKRIHLNVSF